jgi:predicted dithiol-disulfide oxidoreductase (DUF899 family)
VDTSLLVESGRIFLNILDSEGVKPRAAMWVHNRDTETWRLWIVPPKDIKDKRQFYRRIAEAITKHRAKLPSLEASDTEYVLETHPAIQALSQTFQVKGTSSIYVSDNMLNGFYLPDGIILRMAV